MMLAALAAATVLAAPPATASPSAAPPPPARRAAPLAKPAAPACDPSTQLAVQTSLQAVKANDRKTAEGLLDAELPRCPAAAPLGRLIRVLRAELAVADADWTGARAVLAGVDRPGGAFGPQLSFVALRADVGLKDAPAFAADRAALLAAVDAALVAAGRRVERWETPAATVTAYDAPLLQGAFLRSLEFVIAPKAAFAYPRTIMLTDDLAGDRIAAQLGQGPPGRKTYFVDLYTCGAHTTLPPPSVPAAGAPPSYDVVKAMAAAYAAGPGVQAPDGGAPGAAAASSSSAPSAGSCPSAAWLAPGLSFGATR